MKLTFKMEIYPELINLEKKFYFTHKYINDVNSSSYLLFKEQMESGKLV